MKLDSPPPPPPLEHDATPAGDRVRRRAIVAILLVLGAIGSTQLCGWWAYHTTLPIRDLHDADAAIVPAESAALAILFVAFWLNRSLNGLVARGLDRLRHPRRATRAIATLAIWLAAAGYFYGSAVEFGRTLAPTWHDSNQHLVQAQLLLHGRLWAPQHALADQMETFFVLTKPVYAAIHFPGTSMLYAPLLWLGVTPAAFSSLMGGAVVALTYRVIGELVDGAAAALSVPFLLGLTVMRELSVMLISHHMFLVPTLLAFLAFLRWRHLPGLGWAVAIGCLCGYAGIMRPVEALAYAAAIGVGMLVSLRGAGVRRAIVTVLVVVAAASPWLALQAMFNYNVTGHWLRPPYEEYVQRFQPAVSYGSYGERGATTTRPIETALPQKVDYYNDFIHKALVQYQETGVIATALGDRIPQTLATVTPFPLVLAFALPGLIYLRRIAAGWILPLAAVLFGALYLPHVFYLLHYPVAIVPVAAFLVTFGIQASGHALAGEGTRSVEAFFSVVLLACCAANLPQVNRYVHDDDGSFRNVGVFVNARVPGLVKEPAIVLSYYRDWSQPFDAKADNPHDEPVYTIDALWPEDSPIARFNDLGPARNREIYAFFATRQPSRTVYLLDRRDHQLAELGSVTDLLAHGEPRSYFDLTKRAPPTTRIGSIR